MMRPSWYVKEATCRRSSGSTWRPKGNRLAARALKISPPRRTTCRLDKVPLPSPRPFAHFHSLRQGPAWKWRIRAQWLPVS
eukprot:2101504-Alexandrium_andersonii.AAC.1